MFKFNRYYFLFSLIFSIATPLLKLDLVSFTIPFYPQIQELSTSTGTLVQNSDESTLSTITTNNFILALYTIVSSVLLLRYSINILRITQKIKRSNSITYFRSQIILTDDLTLPYSFFRYIIVNRDQYESGDMERDLLVHEQAHCTQYHSVDILVSELIKTVLWFNPLVWLFHKEIQLNHEYLADSEVLSKQSLKVYQSTLLNIVFRNNSTYLASDFSYSLTKKRLIMMQKSFSKTKRIGALLAAPLFLFLGLVVASAQLSPEEAPTSLVAQNDTTLLTPIPSPTVLIVKQVEEKKKKIAPPPPPPPMLEEIKKEKKIAPPPPPPPPPPMKEEVEEKSIYKRDKNGRLIAPPPPPHNKVAKKKKTIAPPPPSLDQVVEMKRTVAPPPPTQEIEIKKLEAKSTLSTEQNKVSA